VPVRGWHDLPACVSILCLPDVITCDQISQIFPLCFCILQAMNYWRWEWPGNEAMRNTRITLHDMNWYSNLDEILAGAKEQDIAFLVVGDPLGWVYTQDMCNGTPLKWTPLGPAISSAVWRCPQIRVHMHNYSSCCCNSLDHWNSQPHCLCSQVLQKDFLGKIGSR